MYRLFVTMKTDVRIQWRNHLYTIGIGVSMLVALGLGRLGEPEQLSSIVPTAGLLVLGGSTLLYVAALMILERDEGILDALLVSPLSSSEYLLSKTATLTGLATLEFAIMIGGATGLMSHAPERFIPNLLLACGGVMGLGALYTLIGVISVVRYDTITECLVPMIAIASILQLPFLYVLEVIPHWSMLLIPTTAPTLLIEGAWTGLSPEQWAYGFGYTFVSIAGASVWAHRAFHHHVRLKGG